LISQNASIHFITVHFLKERLHLNPASHEQITTIGLRSQECRRRFDYLYLRIGALNTCNLKIETHRTRFFLLDKKDGMFGGCFYTTKN
jgi:hypothetical protein